MRAHNGATCALARALTYLLLKAVTDSARRGWASDRGAQRPQENACRRRESAGTHGKADGVGYELIAGAFVVTFPFGAWRATTRRLSLRWFLAIHVPVPFIFLMRHEAGYSYTFIPWMVIACLSAQVLGAKAMSYWRARRSLAAEAARKDDVA